jgi:uncharacterized alpha/beta hydrolase family protein
MLIDKGVSAGEVITLKLTSGEELVARLEAETDTHYKLVKPMVIGMGERGPGLMPYLFTVAPDKTIPLLKSTVTVVVSSDKVFADQYIQNTTNIKLV